MSKKPIYYNSTGLTDAALFEAIEAAKIQDDRVKLIYQVKNRPMSASEVWQIYKTWFKGNPPITSIRRSINTLIGAGVLWPTTETRTGLYGRPERIWVKA